MRILSALIISAFLTQQALWADSRIPAACIDQRPRSNHADTLKLNLLYSFSKDAFNVLEKPNGRSLRAPARFYLPEERPSEIKIKNYDRVDQSTISVLTDTGNAPCSGTFISADGYLLTARHCLPIFLAQNQMLEDIPIEGHDGLKYQRLRRDRFKNASFKLWLNNTWVSARIVTSGKGDWDNETEQKLINQDIAKADEIRTSGIGIQGDFVVLKVDLDKPTVCSPAAAEKPRGNIPVFALNYPSQTTRGDGFDVTKPLQKYFSHGIINDRVTDNPCVRNVWELDKGTDKDEQYARWFLGVPGTMMSTADAVPGSSGGGLFDLSGSLRGIVSQVQSYNHDTNQRFCGGTHFLTIGSIQNQIRQAHAEDPTLPSVEELFSCKSPATE